MSVPYQLALEHPVRRLDDRVVVGVAGARRQPLDAESREQRVDSPLLQSSDPLSLRKASMSVSGNAAFEDAELDRVGHLRAGRVHERAVAGRAGRAEDPAPR